MKSDRIKKLIQTLKEKKLKREKDLHETKLYLEREKEIEEAHVRAVKGFYCRECKEDFDALGWKIVQRTKDMPPRAWYEARCKKEHVVRLHITDKHLDPYYFESRMLVTLRKKMHKELLTPADPEFRLVYPAQWRRMEEERIMREAMEEEEAQMEMA